MASSTVVLSLVGKQGAGKSTLGAKLARYLGSQHIETSDVVKKFSTSTKRADLAKTKRKTKNDPNWLGEAIYKEFLEKFKEGNRSAVLTGVREVEVHDYLKRRGLLIVIIEITASPDTRFKRLRELEKVLDANEFLDGEIRERLLGLNEVVSKAHYEVPTSTLSDPDKIVRVLVNKIVNDGRQVR